MAAGCGCGGEPSSNPAGEQPSCPRGRTVTGSTRRRGRRAHGLRAATRAPAAEPATLWSGGVAKMAETASETGIEGRIVNFSSLAHSWVKRDVLPPLQNLLKPHKLYDPTRAYAYSKLANILHTMELARQLKEGDVEVTVNAVHPGTVKTGIIRDHEGLIADSVCFLVSGLLKSPSQGASTTCYVALCPRLRGVSGRYFADCNERSCSSLAQNAGVARNLWLETNAIVHKGDDGKMAYTATGRSSVPGLIRKQEIRMDRDEY